MGLTQLQVAEKLGVAYQTMERWEHNRTPISQKNRFKILAFLDNYLPESPATPAGAFHAGYL
jgi:transcriptional regulator with XRE-family HTH domain